MVHMRVIHGQDILGHLSRLTFAWGSPLWSKASNVMIIIIILEKIISVRKYDTLQCKHELQHERRPHKLSLLGQ